MGTLVASLTVRDLDADVKRRFVEKAKRVGLSTEAYHREVVRNAALAEDEREEGEAPEAWLARVLGPVEALEISAADQAEIDRAREEARVWRASDQEA